jgi:divalent metal cation (Fe/Co/Zn/Cd) transporter
MRMHYFSILILSFVLMGVGVGLYYSGLGSDVIQPVYIGLIAGGAVVFFVWVGLYVYRESKKGPS